MSMKIGEQRDIMPKFIKTHADAVITEKELRLEQEQKMGDGLVPFGVLMKPGKQLMQQKP